MAHSGNGGRLRALLIGGAGAAIGAGLLGVPLGTILFVGLLLVCPLMMMGMHGSHSEHETVRDEPIPRESSPRRVPSEGHCDHDSGNSRTGRGPW